MPDLLPTSFPTVIAALMTGRHAREFRKYFGPLVEFDEKGRVTRASLERAIGHPITLERYLAADRRRDAARQWQRGWRTRQN